MSMMCSMQSCKAKSGACGHEKLMMLVAVLMAGFAAYRFMH